MFPVYPTTTPRRLTLEEQNTLWRYRSHVVPPPEIEFLRALDRAFRATNVCELVEAVGPSAVSGRALGAMRHLERGDREWGYGLDPVDREAVERAYVREAEIGQRRAERDGALQELASWAAVLTAGTPEQAAYFAARTEAARSAWGHWEQSMVYGESSPVSVRSIVVR